MKLNHGNSTYDLKCSEGMMKLVIRIKFLNGKDLKPVWKKILVTYFVKKVLTYTGLQRLEKKSTIKSENKFKIWNGQSWANIYKRILTTWKNQLCFQEEKCKLKVY